MRVGLRVGVGVLVCESWCVNVGCECVCWCVSVLECGALLLVFLLVCWCWCVVVCWSCVGVWVYVCECGRACVWAC